MLWRALAVLLCSLPMACSDGDDLDFEHDPGADDPVGTVEGVALEVRDTLGIVDAFEYQGTKYASFRAALTDRDGLCAQVRGHTVPANAVALMMEVQTQDLAEQPPPIRPGRYDLGTSIDDDGHLQEVVARFSATDDECREKVVDHGLAEEGTITIDEITPDRARGSFTLRFGEDAVNGSFDVPLCAVDLPFEATCASGP